MVAGPSEAQYRIDVIAPALPPRLDGIGDYSARVAAALARRSDRVRRVRVLLPEQVEQPQGIDGVHEVAQLFTVDRPASFRGVLSYFAPSPPDWVLLQYNPFSYGRWGFNPHLPLTLERRDGRRQSGRPVRLALMVHEPYLHATNAKSSLMSAWQRWQLRRLVRTSDAIFASTAAVSRLIAPWCPPGAQPVHLPVGANVPVTAVDGREVRRDLGIPEQAVVLGLFGTARNGRLLDLFPRALTAASAAVASSGVPVHFLYMGPDGDSLRKAFSNSSVLTCDGPLTAEEVSRRFAAVDIALAAYVDGVSTRRGGMMAGLAHSVATVGTSGINTDELLAREAGHALMLAPVGDVDAFVRNVSVLAADPDLRCRVGRAGRELYQRECDWPVIVDRMLCRFAEVERAA